MSEFGTERWFIFSIFDGIGCIWVGATNVLKFSTQSESWLCFMPRRASWRLTWSTLQQHFNHASKRRNITRGRTVERLCRDRPRRVKTALQRCTLQNGGSRKTLMRENVTGGLSPFNSIPTWREATTLRLPTTILRLLSVSLKRNRTFSIHLRWPAGAGKQRTGKRESNTRTEETCKNEVAWNF